MSCPGGSRPQLENALCLDLKLMFQRGDLREGRQTEGDLWWTQDGRECARIEYSAELEDDGGTLTLDCTNCERHRGGHECVIHTVELETLPCTYGGHIWYFLCPYTGRRARKLYKWPEIDAFCRRDAVTPLPTYASQRMSGLDRVTAQRWALRRRMGDSLSDLVGGPCKPNRMRWRTFDRHSARDAELAKRQDVYLWQLLGGL